MRRQWFAATLQMLGIALVVVGLVRSAIAGTGPCKVNVQWDENAEVTYTLLNTDGTPACFHQGCPGANNNCEHKLCQGGAHSCRCSNTPQVSATACELRVTFLGPVYPCAGSPNGCRQVSASCTNVSCMGTCPPFGNTPECRDAAGAGQCPACR